MELENRSPDLFDDELPIDGMAKQYIKSIATWAMVMVVCAVIGYVLNILDLFREKEPVAAFGQREGFDLDISAKLGGSNVVATVVTIAIGVLINFFLFRFAAQVRSGIDGVDQAKFNAGFRNLKSYFMAFTLILIVVAVCMLLLFVVGVSAALRG